LEAARAENKALKHQLGTTLATRTTLQEQNTILTATVAQCEAGQTQTKQEITSLKQRLSGCRQAREQERVASIDRVVSIDEETTRRDQAHRQLALMFETQVGLLRAQLLQLHHHHNNNDDEDEEVREHVTDLQVRLSERDAALKVLREELRQRNQARVTATAGAAAVAPPTMTALEALDVGVMALRVSRTEAERTSIALQLTMGQEDLDELRAQNAQLQEALDVLKSQHSQQKQKIRAVARVAVKKQKHSKHEVVRLRDQINALRTDWSSPKETQELTRQLVKWKKKHAALKKNNDGLRNKQRKWVMAEATLKREAEALQQEEEKPTTPEEERKRQSVWVEREKEWKQTLKKRNVDHKRMKLTLKEVRAVLAAETQKRKTCEEDIVGLKHKIADSLKSHQQRKAAVDALREGVNAQRTRNDTLSAKLKEHTALERSLHQLTGEKHRLSLELSEATSRWRKGERAHEAATARCDKYEKKWHSVEANAKQVMEDSERRVQLMEHRLKLSTTKIHDGLFDIATTLVTDINKLRLRLQSAKRSVATSSPSTTTTTTTTTATTTTTTRDMEEETIANVSAMLDMSKDEVEQVLGLHSSPRSSPPSSPRSPSVGTGTTPMRGVRAQHKMAVARLRLALQVKVATQRQGSRWVLFGGVLLLLDFFWSFWIFCSCFFMDVATIPWYRSKLTLCSILCSTTPSMFEQRYK
jgi:hypothetical protein